MTEANVIISIAPGITIGQLKEKLGIEKRVVRAMPNTPALLGEGMTGVCYDAEAFDDGEKDTIRYFYIIRRDVYCGRAADERGCLCQRKFTGLCIHVYRGSG